MYKTPPPMSRPRFFSGEVAPTTLIILYLVVRVALDAFAEFAPYRKSWQPQAAPIRGALAALAEAACSWAVCCGLIKTRSFEPKTVPRSQLLVLAVAFSLSILVFRISEEYSQGQEEQAGRLLLPSMSLIVTAVETRFFQRERPEDDMAQWYLAVTCVALTTAQVIVMNHQKTMLSDSKILQLVALACAGQGCRAFMTFALWLRARYHRLNPMQALHKCAGMSLPGITVVSVFISLFTPPSSSANRSAPASLLQHAGRLEQLHDLATAGGVNATLAPKNSTFALARAHVLPASSSSAAAAASSSAAAAAAASSALSKKSLSSAAAAAAAAAALAGVQSRALLQNAMPAGRGGGRRLATAAAGGGAHFTRFTRFTSKICGSASDSCSRWRCSLYSLY